MTGKRVLIAEDERKIAEFLRDYLVQAGFSVTCIERGDLVVPELRRNPPDMILLDIMLPGKDGMDVCRDVRKFSNVPIIMITARVDEIDRLIGLELGADDYVCKPFSPREVVARVKAVFRRVYPEAADTNYTVGPIHMECSARIVTIYDKPLTLTPSEFDLLKTFMAHPNRVFSRGELLDHVQGYTYEGYERTIDSHIKNLRKKLSEGLPDQEVISTVYGVGYKLNIAP
jgi:two-component system response regulator BaeR